MDNLPESLLIGVSAESLRIESDFLLDLLADIRQRLELTGYSFAFIDGYAAALEDIIEWQKDIVRKGTYKGAR